jgi:hypothetical protein
MKIIKATFDYLNRNVCGSGPNLLNPHRMVSSFQAVQHPDVLAGKKTASEIQKEFTDLFDAGGEVEGHVTKEEFINYYRNLSCSIATDMEFEYILRRCWNYNQSMVTTAVITSNIPRLSVDNVSQPSQSSLNTITKSLAVNDTMKNNQQELSIQGNNYNQRYDDTISKRIVKPPPAIQPSKLKMNSSSSSVVSSIPFLSSSNTIKSSNDQTTTQAITGDAYLLKGLQQRIQSRGLYAYTELRRLFKLADEDESNSLSLQEFKNVMKEYEIEYNDRDLRLIFEQFDRDRNGTIDFEEFMSTLRMPLSNIRLELIKLIYSRFQKYRYGNEQVVHIKNFYSCYNPSQHPDVIERRISEDLALRQFLDSFECYAEDDNDHHNQMVTYQRFVDYYQDLGSCITDDDYFNRLLYGTWEVPEDLAISQETPRSGAVAKLRNQMPSTSTLSRSFYRSSTSLTSHTHTLLTKL